MSVSADMPHGLGEALESNADRIRPFGSRVVHLAVVGSTNDVAAVLATDGAPEGTLVIADAQTAGRGRMGHAWHSPPGAGLYRLGCSPAASRMADHGTRAGEPRDA